MNVELTITTDSFPGGVLLMTVDGELDILTAPEFKERLQDAIESPATAIFVDLTDCGFLDSTALRVFANAARSLDGRNQRLSLIVATSMIRRVFEITHLEDLFTIYPDRDSALNGGVAAASSSDGDGDGSHLPGFPEQLVRSRFDGEVAGDAIARASYGIAHGPDANDGAGDGEPRTGR
jgi:anti-sigma B factor antagonist